MKKTWYRFTFEYKPSAHAPKMSVSVIARHLNEARRNFATILKTTGRDKDIDKIPLIEPMISRESEKWTKKSAE